MNKIKNLFRRVASAEFAAEQRLEKGDVVFTLWPTPYYSTCKLYHKETTRSVGIHCFFWSVEFRVSIKDK